MNSQQGFSLFEMLIALLLGALIVVFGMRLLSSTESHLRLIKQYLQLNQKALLAQQLILKPLEAQRRMSCFDQQPFIKIQGNQISLLDGLSGFSRILSLDSESLIVEGPIPKYRRGETILLSNCQQQRAATVLKVSYSKSKQQQRLYLSKATLEKINTHDLIEPERWLSFYVTASKIYRGRKSLYRRGKQTQEVIPGVSQLEIKKVKPEIYSLTLALTVPLSTHKTLKRDVSFLIETTRENS